MDGSRLSQILTALFRVRAAQSSRHGPTIRAHSSERLETVIESAWQTFAKGHTSDGPQARQTTVGVVSSDAVASRCRDEYKASCHAGQGPNGCHPGRRHPRAARPSPAVRDGYLYERVVGAIVSRRLRRGLAAKAPGRQRTAMTAFDCAGPKIENFYAGDSTFTQRQPALAGVFVCGTYRLRVRPYAGRISVCTLNATTLFLTLEDF